MQEVIQGSKLGMMPGGVQGNTAEELPEVVMACARVSHLDFSQARPFPGELAEGSDSSVTVDHPLHANTFPDDDIQVEDSSPSSSAKRE